MKPLAVQLALIVCCGALLLKELQDEPTNWCKLAGEQSVQKTIKPIAGFGIAFICAEVILGGSRPLFVLSTSNIADGLGLDPVSLIPTPCDQAEKHNVKRARIIEIFVFIRLIVRI